MLEQGVQAHIMRGTASLQGVPGDEVHIEHRRVGQLRADAGYPYDALGDAASWRSLLYDGQQQLCQVQRPIVVGRKCDLQAQIAAVASTCMKHTKCAQLVATVPTESGNAQSTPQCRPRCARRGAPWAPECLRC